MKKFLSAVLFTVLFSAFSMAVFAAGTASLSENKALSQNGKICVELNLNFSAYGIQSDIIYDSDFLQYEKTEFASKAYSKAAVVSQGKLRVLAASDEKLSQNFCRVYFKVLKGGKTAVSLSKLTAADKYGDKIPCSFSKKLEMDLPDSVKIPQPNPKPDPKPETGSSQTNTPGIKNGIKKAGKKTYLYKKGVRQTGTRLVKVNGKTYYIRKGSVSTGKGNRLIIVSKKKYIINSKGTLVSPKKTKVYKTNKGYYAARRNGRIVSYKNTRLVKIGSRRYILRKNSGKIIVNKKSYRLKNKVYKISGTGIAKLKK